MTSPRQLQHQLDLLMADARFQRALAAYRKDDDRHDVAYLAGSETDGRTIDFDRDFAQAIEHGQIKLNGEAFDPRPFIRVHEAIEGAILNHAFTPSVWVLAPLHGKSLPNPAHDLALLAERHAVEHAFGPGSWQPYLASMQHLVKEDNAAEVPNPPPRIMRMPERRT